MGNNLGLGLKWALGPSVKTGGLDNAQGPLGLGQALGQANGGHGPVPWAGAG